MSTVFVLLWLYFLDYHSNLTAMFKNYLKVAFRSIVRSKLTSFINIFGLAFAMACSLLIYLFIHDEIIYDRYNTNADRIYRVTRNFLSRDGSVSLHLGHVAPPFGPLLKNDFPDLEKVARTLQFNVLFSIDENGERKKNFNESNTFIAEPELFDIFTIDVTEGNPATALERPFTVMLSDKMAEKYFDTDQVQGKHLRVNNAFDLEVTGTYKSFPQQSHWHPDFLISFSTLNDSTIYGKRGLETNWGNNSFATYVLVSDQFNKEKMESQFPAFLDNHMGPQGNPSNPVMPSSFTNIFLQPLTDIHLRSHLDSEVEANGNINNVYMMGVIGLFIILIACFNFINLSTARATKRAKEVGLRKVAGAVKNQLIFQYLSESMMISIFAIALAVVFALVALNWMNTFTGKDLTLSIISQWPLFVGLVIVALVVGILAGIYPAFIISGFKPALIVKGKTDKGKGTIRKVLVVAQFSISIMLIIATMITFQQLSFLNNRDLGYSKDQVVTMQYFGQELANNYDAFYNELVKSSAVKNLGRSSRIPTGRLLDSSGAQISQGDSMVATSVVIKFVRTDHEFFDTYEIPFAAGRNFSRDIKTDDSLAYVLNESAVAMIGWTPQEAIGKVFQYGGVKGQVIGVVKDFHFESLHEPIIPLVFQPSPFYSRISLKLAGNNVKDGIKQLEKVWGEFLPERPFEYSFLNDQYQQLYDSEEKQSQLFTLFSGLAILIASLGLFGLATFTTLQRIKEIGIRKVLGASIPSILRLLTTEIVVLILIANVVAWPTAWYFMNKWLAGFAYHINLGVGAFILAGILAVVLGLVTVSAQTLRAAMSNPANTLRYE